MEFIRINNRNNFLIKEIPVLNPASRKYLTFWREQKKRCINGYWSIDEAGIDVDILPEYPSFPESNSWRYMPPACYFYVNFGTIQVNKKGSTSGAKIPSRPNLDDVEWEYTYNLLEARGFSGFELDDNNSCNEYLTSDLTDDELTSRCLDENGNVIKRLLGNFFKKNGDRKIYIPTRDYIRKIFNKPMGDPIYLNDPKNLSLLGTRDGGKSWLSAGCGIAHEILFDGLRLYDKNLIEVPIAEIVVGASISDKSRDLLKKATFIINNLPGKYNKGSKDEVPSPFYKALAGSMGANKELVHLYKKKIGGEMKDVGSGAIIKHRVFTTENPEAAAGGRPGTIVVEEQGLVGNLIAVHGGNDAAQNDSGRKFGSSIYVGTSGNIDKVRDAEIIFNSPESFDMLAFDNIWENEHVDKIGWFIPAPYMARDFKDQNGNTKIKEAYAYFEKRRLTKANSPSKKAFEIEKMNYPLIPSEMFVNADLNIFPVSDIKHQYSRLLSNKKLLNSSYKVNFYIREDNGQVDFKNVNKNPIRDFPILNKKDEIADLTGCPEIFIMPQRADDGTVPSGMYIAGCLTPGEQVMTINGSKNVEDVTYLDELINKDGENVPINKLITHEVKDEDTYSIKVSNTFRQTNFTKEHPIYVSERKTRFISYPKAKKLGISQRYYDFDFNFKKSDELTTNHWIKVPNVYKKEIKTDLENKWTNEGIKINKQISNPLYSDDFWWFIGLWIGDGWCDKKYSISIALNKEEIYYIEKLKNIIENLFKCKSSIRNRPGIVEVTFSNMQLNAFLNKNFGKYALHKHIPEWVKYLNKSIKISLIQGYLDSDGSIMNMSGYYSTEFVSINLKLLESFQDMLFSLGIVSGLSLLRPERTCIIASQKEGISKETYHLRIANHGSIKLAKLIDDYSDIKIKRIDFENLPIRRRDPKNNCYFDENEDYIYFKIIEINKSKYTGIVYNFECETNTFMCNHITTHNCDPIDDDDNSDVQRSLQSAWIMNRLTGELAFEYTGRTQLVSEFYEQFRRALIYYNAKCNYENNKKGLYAHFYNKASVHLLVETPEILLQKDMQKSRGIGNKSLGTNTNTDIIAFGLELILQWLLSKSNVQPGENSQLTNIQTIKSPALLKEFISFKPDGNFDRISALIMLFILREDKRRFVTAVKKRIKSALDDDFFKDTWEEQPNNNFLY